MASGDRGTAPYSTAGNFGVGAANQYKGPEYGAELSDIESVSEVATDKIDNPYSSTNQEN